MYTQIHVHTQVPGTFMYVCGTAVSVICNLNLLTSYMYWCTCMCTVHPGTVPVPVPVPGTCVHWALTLICAHPGIYVNYVYHVPYDMCYMHDIHA